MSLSALMVVVCVVLLMQRVREFKAGGRACAFCHRHNTHAPWCPARGMEG